MCLEQFDVVVVGAGLSGIGAGYYLQSRCPRLSYAILEGRGGLGGTWDLFRFPGIRSDSDMFTLGYSFRPWKEARAMADGESILTYLRETAREFGIDRRIRFGHRVTAASWSSEKSLWTVDAQSGPERTPVRFTCRFLYLCSGYYDYEHGYEPAFAGSGEFQGLIIHPQHWPRDFDYAGRRIVVIGSGSTAVTLIPALAQKAAHVTMLQRSPSYIVSRPAEDSLARLVRRILPERATHRLVRWKNVLLGIYFYQICRRAPGLARRLLRRHLAKELPADFDLDTHFRPAYDPWDQRVCLVPDSDFFQAIKAGRVSVVTDHVERFTPNGIRLKSGRELPADIIVTATGLSLLACGGIRLSVDGAGVEPGRTLAYKGCMLSNVPNLAICLGYINASWTLRADLTSAYVCRLLEHMNRRGYRQCVPRGDGPLADAQPLLGLQSNYVKRGLPSFPKQGSKAPWVFRQNYLLDWLTMKFSSLEDGTLQFSKGSLPPALGTSPRPPVFEPALRNGAPASQPLDSTT